MRHKITRRRMYEIACRAQTEGVSVDEYLARVTGSPHVPASRYMVESPTIVRRMFTEMCARVENGQTILFSRPNGPVLHITKDQPFSKDPFIVTLYEMVEYLYRRLGEEAPWDRDYPDYPEDEPITKEEKAADDIPRANVSRWFRWALATRSPGECLQFNSLGAEGPALEDFHGDRFAWNLERAKVAIEELAATFETPPEQVVRFLFPEKTQHGPVFADVDLHKEAEDWAAIEAYERELENEAKAAQK